MGKLVGSKLVSEFVAYLIKNHGLEKKKYEELPNYRREKVARNTMRLMHESINIEHSDWIKSKEKRRKKRKTK